MLKKVELRRVTWGKETAPIFATRLAVFWKRKSLAE